jgi:hypothetical protein
MENTTFPKKSSVIYYRFQKRPKEVIVCFVDIGQNANDHWIVTNNIKTVDIKGVIRIRKSKKNRQHNGQKKKGQNDKQRSTNRCYLRNSNIHVSR